MTEGITTRKHFLCIWLLLVAIGGEVTNLNIVAHCSLCCCMLCYAVLWQGAVWSCVLDPTATLAATGSADFSAKIWDALTGLEKASLQHKHIVRTCCFAPCSTKLATGGGWCQRDMQPCVAHGVVIVCGAPTRHAMGQ